MIYTPSRCIRPAGLLLLMLLLAFGAQAQLQTGNILGHVRQSDGAVLPGVTVTLTGVGAPQTTVTDTDGEFRFLNLTPGSYSLNAELAGFGSANRAGVSVNIGRNSVVDIELNPSVSQSITVTAEAPLLDVRKAGTGATVTEVELTDVPTARDPWVILQQVPGVLTDRLNVGGNESGQQSAFVGKGAGGDQATFNVDGVNITDMSALGSSPDYYDFDAIEEIQVTTGGTDPRIQTPGVQLNMVTKRGTNDLQGSARYFLVDGEWQEDALPDAEGAHYLKATNEINEITDMGIEAGGPIIRDRLWLWGAYSDQQIDLFVSQNVDALVPGGAANNPRYADNTTLETLNGKLNAQIMASNSAVFTYWDSGKAKFGRNASPTRPPATTYNQDDYGTKGSWKFEDTHIFSSNLYLTGMYSKVNGGFQLVPNAGKNCTDKQCLQGTANAYLDAASGIWARNFYYAFIERPQEQMRLDGSTFFDTGALNHELKFGVGYRETEQHTQSSWGGGHQYFVDYSNIPGYPSGFGGVYYLREGRSNVTTDYTDIYVGDTVLWGNLTLQAGLRWDVQKGSAGAISTDANPDLPNLLPAASFTTSDEVEFDSISPRIGLTWALGEQKKTLLRAGYNRYVDQLGTGLAASLNPLNAYQYAYFYGVQDLNGDKRISRSEIGDGYLYDTYNILGDFTDLDHALPTAQLNRLDPDLDPPHTDEFIIGAEHELFPDFTIGMTYTHRDLDNFIWFRPEKTRGAGDFYTSADYTLLGNATGNLAPCNTFSGPTDTSGDCTGPAFSVPVYVLKPGVASPDYFVIQNRPDYTQEYEGLELTFVKRMSRRWMLRGNLSWNDWTQQVGPNAFIDPTPLRTTYGCYNCDGATVVQGSGTGSGSKGGVYISSRWSYNVTGVYQLPWGFNIGASVTGREGYPIPYVSRVNTGSSLFGGEGFKFVLADGVDDNRLEDVFNLDLRLAKDFRFLNRVGLTLSVDAFNVTNDRTILQRQTRLYSHRDPARGNFNGRDRITEYQSPRVFRVGARVTF